MSAFTRMPIRRKQMWIIMLTSGAALLLVLVAFLTYDITAYRSATISSLSTLAEIIGNNSTAGLDFNDSRTVEETLSGLKAEPEITAAVIYDKSGAVFARYSGPVGGQGFSLPVVREPGYHFEGHSLLLFKPIVGKGDPIGTVLLVSDLRPFYSRVRKYLAIALGVLCLAALVALALSARLQDLVSGPILQLVETTRRVAQDENYSLRAIKQSQDELGALVDSFNDMLEQIQVRDMQLQRAKDVLEQRVCERTRDLEQEVTERRLAEERLAERARLAAMGGEVGVALTRHDLLPEILKACAESMVRHLDAAFARIWTLNERENVLELIASAGMYTHLDGPHSRVPVGKFKIGLIAQEAKPHLTNSVIGDPRVGDQEWARREGMVAFAGYPLMVDGRVAGVMALFARRSLSDNTLRELAAIADGIALGIVRKQGEQALRAQEQRTRSIIDQAFDAVITTDITGTIIDWNEQAERMLGWPRSEIIGRNLIETLVPANERAQRAGQFERFRATGEWPRANELVESTALHNDGREVPVELTIKPIHVGATHIFNAFLRDITQRKKAEAELQAAQKQLLDISRQAGMAEVATGILHNVGNVLNSVNITATLVEDQVRKSRVSDLARLVKLLDEHAARLGEYLTTDPRGRMVPEFLGQLAERLRTEQAAVLKELASLRSNVDHIKEIVAMQQSYARVSGFLENVEVAQLAEDTLRMNAGALSRHSIKVVREYAPIKPITTDKHKVLQILVNLVRNAKYACSESDRTDKELVMRLANGADRVRISVIDNGVGIPAENLVRIFNHGFTTRKDGHGFGLHSGALAAKELGGSLTVHSDGPGHGATFTLELPYEPSPTKRTG